MGHVVVGVIGVYVISQTARVAKIVMHDSTIGVIAATDMGSAPGWAVLCHIVEAISRCRTGRLRVNESLIFRDICIFLGQNPC